ncbi:MAG: sugar ABC transporter ATP-binding protein [Verrucomicrobia bacterium]|nr:sugar ABC transporter ATP-binding protein [Verrucomicrobiota bacterium]
MEPLRAVHLSKSYGGTHALKDVSLDIRPGEVHALCGENGAGKSTLIKILSGVLLPNAGTVQWNETPLPLGRVHSVEAHGILAVHQEPVVFPHLNAVDNLFVGREPAALGGAWLDQSTMRKKARAILANLGEELPLTQPVGDMSLAQRQMVSIARALLHQCRILILDEPTASLSARESESLFEKVNTLKQQGVGILYVSHRLEEIFRLADRVTVLRDGTWVATSDIASLNQEALIQHMVGRDITQKPGSGTAPDESKNRPPILEIKNLSREGVFQKISFKIQPGEILGMSGLVGAGRSEIARGIFGIDPFDAGEIIYLGSPLSKGFTIQDTIQAGMAMVPEDRQQQGLVLPLSVETNLLLPSLREFQGPLGLKTKAMRSSGKALIEKLGIKTETPDHPAHSLSGGNQQKIVIGKWVHRLPKLFILDEPTRGVDVGAKHEVHRLIRELAAQGSAVLLISSELPEILSLSHRILVLCEGTIRGELKANEATQEQLLKLALPEEARRSA